MLRSIPATTCHVHPSRRGELSVNDGDFLVMAAARRMDVIQFEVDAGVVERVSSERELGIANVREEYGKAPREDENVQARMTSDQLAQKLP
jgi:hypothetical protein